MKKILQILFPSIVATLFIFSITLAANVFPVSLNDWDDNDVIESGWADALEAEIGIDGSAVTTSLNYQLNNASSIDPGHLHTSAGISGQISVAKGGTGAATLTGLLQGNGTSAITGITNSSTVGQVLRVTGASTYAWGALDLADTDAVTGVLPSGNLDTAVILSTEIDTSSELLAIVTDETGTGSLVFGTSPTITTSLTQDGDAADAGYLRLQNATNIAWEASPAGTDMTLGVDASEILQYSGAFNATGAITGSNLSGTNTGDQTITLSGDVSGTGTGSFTTTIGSDKILESMLKAVDAAVDEECLTKEDTTGDFEWQPCTTGSAPSTATYITQTADGTLSAEQALSSLSSGIMRVATTTGVITSLTTSADIIANISDETGSGLLVFGTSPTLTTPRFADLGFIADANGNEMLTFDSGASAANNFQIASAPLSSSPLLSAVGDDANISIGFQAKGTGDYTLLGKSGEPAVLVLREATANGTNAIGVTVAGALSADFILTLPSATDTLVGKDTTDILTNKTIDLTSNTLVGSVAEFNAALESADFYTTGGTDVAFADGGTGISSWTQYLIPYAATTTSIGQIAIGDSGQVLTSNGAGAAPTFQTISAGSKISVVTTDVSVSDTAVETTIVSVSIPANTLSTNNAVKATIYVSDYDHGTSSTPTLTLRMKYGSTTMATAVITTPAAVLTNLQGEISILLAAVGATNSQEATMTALFSQDAGSGVAGMVERYGAASGTAAEDSTGALNFIVTVQWSQANVNNLINMETAIVEKVQ